MTRIKLLLLCLVAAPGSSALATSYRLAHTFVDPNGGPNDFFGTAVAIEDGVVAIKSRSGYADGDGLSRTHVFESNVAGGWDQAATFDFDSGDNMGNPFLGEELAIDGGVIAASYGPEFLDRTADEPVQVFTKASGDWVRHSAVLAIAGPLPDPVPVPFPFAGRGLGSIGRFVDVSGDFIIASESNATLPGGSTQDRAGVARVFQRQADDSWLESANLFSASPTLTLTTTAVALDDTTAAVVYRDSRERESSLYFFERSLGGAWTSKESFTIDTDVNLDFLRLDGDTAILHPALSGQFLTYQRVDGEWQASTSLPEVTRTDSLGFAIEEDLFAQTIKGVLGEPARIDVYRRDALGGWDLQTTIADPQPDSDLDFGWKLDFDNGRLLVGAKSVGTGLRTSSAGAAYLFIPVPEPGSFGLLCGAFLLSFGSQRRSAAYSASSAY